MQLKPRPGCQYRRTDTKQLVDPDLGFAADPADLDIARHLRRGDLVPVIPPAAKRRPAAPKE